MKNPPQPATERAASRKTRARPCGESPAAAKRVAVASGRGKAGFVVLTIGHSTRTLAEFLQLIRTYGVTLVADVRTIPRSRFNPQFNATTLARALAREGLHYVHLPGLGGLRHARPDSVNTAWRNASFRGYADYMQTPQFKQSLAALIKRARRERTVLMCAEAVPWRCHRSLIADALLVRGIRAEDIIGPTSRRVHTLTPFARVRGHRLTYPAPVQATKLGASSLPTPAAQVARTI